MMPMLLPNPNSLPDPASFFRESCAEGDAEAAPPPRRATKASFNFHRESEQLRSRPTDGPKEEERWGGDRAPTLFEVTFQMRLIVENNSATVSVLRRLPCHHKHLSKAQEFSNCNAGWTEESEDGHPERGYVGRTKCPDK